MTEAGAEGKGGPSDLDAANLSSDSMILTALNTTLEMLQTYGCSACVAA